MRFLANEFISPVGSFVKQLQVLVVSNVNTDLLPYIRLTFLVSLMLKLVFEINYKSLSMVMIEIEFNI